MTATCTSTFTNAQRWDGQDALAPMAHENLNAL
jgi:hypothetical protein